WWYMVRPGATSRLAVRGFWSPTRPGEEHSFTVAAQDQYGNPTDAYAGTVHFTSSDPAAVLPADYTFAEWDYGVLYANAYLNTPGGQWITVTDVANANTTGSQTAIEVLQTIAIGDTSVIEGNTGTRAATFTVSLAAAATQPVTVHYATADGTATAGS